MPNPKVKDQFKEGADGYFRVPLGLIEQCEAAGDAEYAAVAAYVKPFRKGVLKDCVKKAAEGFMKFTGDKANKSVTIGLVGADDKELQAPCGTVQYLFGK